MPSYAANPAELNVRFHYLMVPVLAKVYLFKSLNVQVGPQVGFLLARGGTSGNKKLEESDFGEKQPVDFGICLGLGYEFNNNMFVDGRYVWGLNSVYKHTESIRNRCIQLSVGYRFSL